MASSEPRPWATSAETRSGVVFEPLGAALLHLGDGQQPFVVPHPARVLVHHDFERRHLLLDFQELVDLLLVLGEREARAGMLDDIGELVGDRILVDRHRHAAQRLRGAHRPVEQRAIVADHDQPIAAAEAVIGQARGEQADLGRDMAPAMALPDAVFLFAIGRPVGARAGALGQQLGKRVPSVGRGIGRSRRHPLLSLPGNALFDCLAFAAFRRAHSHSQFATVKPAAGRRRRVKAAPPVGRFSTVTLPSWLSATRATIARPRPAAFRPRAVAPPEAPEDQFALGLGHARPVVEHAHRAVGRDLDLDRAAGRGMADGVLDQVAHGPEQRLGMAVHPDRLLSCRRARWSWIGRRRAAP